MISDETTSDPGARLISGLRAFAELLEQEARSLDSGDSALLVELARRKQQLAMEISQVAIARESTNPRPDDPYTKRIRELSALCEALNRDNGNRIQSEISAIRPALAVLTGGMLEETYSAGGELAHRPATGRHLASS